MLKSNDLNLFYDKYKSHGLNGRYITNNHILPLLRSLSSNFSFSVIGKSEQQNPIYSIDYGVGSIKILIWSQMHGNESTTTKSIFDCLNVFNSMDDELFYKIFKIKIVPILNPDGAVSYNRYNSNNIDLNRDADNLTQIETRILMNLFNEFKPNFCFNMHDQRSIYSAGYSNNPATVSFLSPSQDINRSISHNRKIAMQIISKVSDELNKLIPNQISRFDDGFNINCTGDKFQSLGVATILFEAGHFQNDYSREMSRKYMTIAIYEALLSIVDKSYLTYTTENYFEIPENKPLFLDLIIKNVILNNKTNDLVDIGISFKEILENDNISLIPSVEKIENLNSFFGHRIIDAKRASGLQIFGKHILQNDIVNSILINNRKINLFTDDNLT